MTFQAFEEKGKNFLKLLDNDLNVIELSYVKGGPWLQLVGHSNLLCAQATRAISNHIPIREYKLIKSRRHSLQLQEIQWVLEL